MVREQRRLNLEDIARMSGVSRSTVSRVLNDDPKVSDAVRTRVRTVLTETRFHPNAAARSLATHRTGIIGLVFPRVFTMMFTDPWASVLIKGCLEGSERADLSLVHMLVSTDDQASVDRFFERSVTGRHLDGVILGSHVLGDKLVARLQEEDFPYMLIGRDEHRTANFVDIDNRQAARIATQHLIDHGYRRIVHLSGPPDLVTALDRQDGFFDAIREAGNDPDTVQVECGYFEQVTGFELTLRLLQQPDPPDAIFAADDAMAIGAIQAARELGRSVPNDVAIVGFDDIDMNRMYRPELTTVRQPSDALGRTAVGILSTMITNPSTTPVQRWLSAELIVRGSCGCSFSNSRANGLVQGKEGSPFGPGPNNLIVQT
ncbi:MAG: LacI family DNA-binding transcriptional regulator [Chloroflexia bacterium]|nr:LacI family DNA-binding transcriptional regulator [Chloroflexia bacterium]